MMQDSKLIGLLKALSKKDLAQLGKYFQFHYRKTNNAVVLFNHLADFAPDFNAEDLDKELAYKQVFKSKSYNDNVMRRTTSKLLEMCEEFIALNQLQQNEKAKKLALMRFYNEQGLDKHFKSVYRTWEKEQQQAGQIDELYFFNQFLVEQEISNQIFRQQDRSVEPNLKSISKELDNFYLMHKLKICCSSINYQLLSNTQYELPLMDELVAYLKKNEAKQPPIVCAYFYALLTLVESDNEMHFRKLSTLLFANTQTFHPDEQGDLFVLSQNYCIKRINKGDEKYLNELLELYKTGLDNGLLLKKGFLSPLDYKNIVTLGTRLQFFEWTENFIKTYSKHLNQKIRDSYYHYNLARLYFGKKDFNQILPLLNKVEHQEVFVMLDVKVMMMKTYYELGNIDLLEYIIKSVYRFFAKMEDLNMVQNEVLKFLRKALYLNDTELRKAFLKLKNKLEMLSEHPYEKRSFLYLDLISWLESKLSGKHVGVIIREKFEKRNAK